jgi:hypothetical protein
MIAESAYEGVCSTFGAFAQCHLVSRRTGFGAVVGQAPRSARIPLDPLFGNEFRFFQTQQADEGVGCGPGGPPHQACQLSRSWKTKILPAKTSAGRRTIFGLRCSSDATERASYWYPSVLLSITEDPAKP